jgi:hypothetical protein
MARIIVYVRGGNVQDIIADTPGLRVMLVDYDNEESQPMPHRTFEEIRCDSSLLARTVAGKDRAGSS